MGKGFKRFGWSQTQDEQMKELSLHILDIVQNSIQAKATRIEIEVDEVITNNLLKISITDNGVGMEQAVIERVLDPFFTTKNKKTGLGIPLIKQHAELSGGNLEITSEVGIGTRLTASFEHRHFDRQPMGNIVQTIIGLLRSFPAIDFIYKHSVNAKNFELNMVEIKKELDGLPVNAPEIIKFLEQLIEENLTEIGAT